jgi:serine/threonine protein kinase
MAESDAAQGGGRSPASAPGVPRIGDVIDSKYKTESVLGSGGMGIVVAARHLQLGQRVAIKFLRTDVGQDTAAVARFLREARAVVALSSEHVARVLDVGTLDSGAPYIVMEYLAGRDIAQALRESGRFTVAEAVAFVLQACEAIAEAHALGIVHRDLKPSNLFVARRLDGSPLVKVLDFGISRAPELGSIASRGVPSLTASGLMIGSPLYMSPEQIRNAKGVDGRTDVWSLGVILYELLTGAPPFSGETLGEVLAQIVAKDAPPVRRTSPDVPEALAQLISKCLDRDPALRVQSIAELATGLLPFAGPSEAVLVDRILRTRPGAVGAAQDVSRRAQRATFTPTPGTTLGSWLRPIAAQVPRGLWPYVGVGVLVIGAIAIGIAAMITRAPDRAGAASGAAPSAVSAPPQVPSGPVQSSDTDGGTGLQPPGVERASTTRMPHHPPAVGAQTPAPTTRSIPTASARTPPSLDELLERRQ